MTQTIGWVLSNKLLALFGLAAFYLIVSTDAQSGDSYRLPKNVIPVNYELKLKPNLENNTYEGEVTISLRTLKRVNVLSLHAKDLDIKSVEVSNSSNKNITVASTDVVTSSEIIQVKLQHEVKANSTYKLRITFTGKLDNRIIGFYKSTLQNGDTMVASKFEPTYARQAFPCFDEPDLKATYEVTLVKPTNYVALSNMNEECKTADPATNTEVITFAKSVPMSSYLVCFVVCNFDAKESEIETGGIGKNFKLRSFAQKKQIHKIEFAHDIGEKAIKFYLKYFNIAFPLPKLDLIGIPDYISGATEHWGLITFREVALLIDNETASSINKINVAITVSHELAHMWFGNLVTMKWWDDLWLNEGFATYMQFYSLNTTQPEWTMLDQFLTRCMHPVLDYDAKLSSHPIVQTVATPDEITALFDIISYRKGASVIRMLAGMIGQKNFRSGISDYLNKFAFGNAVTLDLLTCLERYFKKDYPDLNLIHIMNTWTRQMGFPMLSVKPGDKPCTYVITQTRFLANPEAENNQTSEFKFRWYVPVTYKTNLGIEKEMTWFPDTQNNITIVLGAGVKWLKINNDQVGYCRIQYTEDMYRNLIEALKNKSDQLTISDRAHLLNDIFAMAEGNYINYSIALDLSTYLSTETDLVPWQAASSIFSMLSDKLLNTTAHDNLQKYIQKLVAPLYAKLSWEKTNLTVIKGLLRSRILALATRFALPDAVEKTRSLFLNWLNSQTNGTQIEPDLREFVYYYGMNASTQADWDKLWQIYLKEEDVQELSKFQDALSGPSDANILKRYLEFAWDEKNVRSQDYLDVISLISSNPFGTDIVWDYVRANWPKLVDRFTLNSRYLGGLMPSITSTFNTVLKLKEMEEFFALYPDAGAGASSRADALETVRNNMKWMDTHQNDVSAWLEKAVKPQTS